MGQTEIVIGPGAPVEWGLPLPAAYLPDSNERCIEVPLAVAVAAWCPRVLDAGCALNIKNLHHWISARLVHVTLGKEKVYADPRRQYVTADLRALPFQDQSFPGVVCVSTLEHIGMDNRHYGHKGEFAPDSMWDAVRELRRVCAGAMLVSVPCGRGGCHPSGKWRAFGPGDVQRLLTLMQPARIAVNYYARDEAGWRLAGPEIGSMQAWRGDKTVTGIAVVRGICATA